MQKYSDVVLDSRGNALQGISVTVKTYPGAATATIYSDNGITTTTNPLTTDANGRFEFYAADGRYSLEISGTGFTTQTLTDVILFDDPLTSSQLYATSLNMYGVAAQYGGYITSRGTAGLEWGHTNTSGYGCVLGANAGSGAPFIAFNSGPGTTNNTFRTFGLRGHVISTDNDGALRFCSLATATGDNQTETEQVRILRTDSANRYITLTGSNGGNPTISTSAGDLLCGTGFSVNGRVSATSYISAHNGTATPAGGAANSCFYMGSANVGIYWGSGAPTVSAAQGSIYLRTDGGASTRIYSNNNGTTGWSAITSA